MITGYKIKKIGDEEVLYVYLDFNYEFGNFKNVKDDLKKNIKEFIKKNKIAFKGTMVALVVGGMVTGSMSLKNNNNYISNVDNNLVISEELNIPDNIILNNEEEINEVEESINEMVDKQVYSAEKETSENVVDKKAYIEEKEIDTKNIIEETNVVEKQIEDKVEDNVTEETLNHKTYVTVRRSSGEIQNIELEEYIIGVVGAEMPASFHMEALKSQAIIARTYALKSLSRGQILTDNESTQSFKDNNQLRSLWGNSFDTYYNKIKNAVLSTSGMYLTYNGSYIEAVYHSTSNGVTETASYVWGNSFPYLVSVDSIYDNTNPSFIQEKVLSYQELSNKLGFKVNINTEFNIINRTPSNRVESIMVDETVYNGTQFRQLLGLRSTDFDINKTTEGIVFTTRGYGHGVGLSQYGANGMAKNGYSYDQILMHYYPGITINY